MAIVLDPTNGITNVNGTAALPAITGTDTDTGLYFGTNTLGLSANGSTVATISTTGLSVTGSITTGGVVGSPYAMKNRIINGAMMIDQRNNGSSVTNTVATAAGVYTLDRWAYWASQASKFTIQQNAASVTPPVGYKNYLGITSSSAYTVGSSEYFIITQTIEGLNVADLAWGTANAKTVTLSFQVYSSLTGTFGGVVQNSAGNRSYPFSYTISSANTWTQISVTIAGDTTGTWLTTNGIGMYVIFGLGVGSTFSNTAGAWAAGNYNSVPGATSVVGTNGATFYITGVQLEVGSSATSFEWRPYGMELALCQRYYWSTNAASNFNSFFRANGIGYSTTQVGFVVQLPVPMRASPSSLSYSGTIKTSDTVNVTSITSLVINQANFDSPLLFATVASGITQFRPYILFAGGDTTSSVGISAEL